MTSASSEPQGESSAPRDGRYHHGSLKEALLSRAAEVIEDRGVEALSLRGLARDLGVSHGAPNRHFRSKEALLAALASKGFEEARAATLAAKEKADPDPWCQLNAMGRGYLRWAIANRTLFRVMEHPDVARQSDPELLSRMAATKKMVKDAVHAAQRAGRYPEVDLDWLTLFTRAVPLGVAQSLSSPIFSDSLGPKELDDFVAQIMELVVPIMGRPARKEA